MDDERFFSGIESRADFESRDQAIAAAESTLGVLGERLQRAEVDALADELPENLAAALASSGDEAAGFSPEEFVEWVREAEREQAAGLDVSDTRLHVQAVLESLSQSVDGDVWNVVRSRLPSEYDRLYETA